MAEEEKTEVIVPSKHASIETMRGMVEEEKARKREKKEGPSAFKEAVGSLQESIQTLVEEQREILQALERSYQGQQLVLGQFLEQYSDAQKGLVESLWRLPPEQERARWVDVEYDQEFYTRFTPTMEPKFYAKMESEERKIWDARWQLARAAFFKKVNSAFPEKQFENVDLQLLTNEQMEKLYKIPGVQQSLEWYANQIANRQLTIIVVRKPGKPERINILGCKDESEFEEFRKRMRETIRGVKGIRGKEKEEQDLLLREADAVAWNWLWCGNLIESIDSRYSTFGRRIGGERHGDLPGKMISDDTRSTFHPQEKFESKCGSGLRWGAFGEWGVTQTKRIRDQYTEEDEIVFTQATSPNKFWQPERTSKQTGKGGNYIRVYTPECYPTMSLKSFWEETVLDGKSLLDFLLSGERIPWDRLKADPWIPYLPIKFKKATDLFKYFKPGVPMETQKFGYAKIWAEPIIDSLNRLPALGLEKGKGGEPGGKLTKEERHNLKVWAVYAAYGGVGHTDRHEATMNLGTLERKTLERALRDKNVHYLEKEEDLKII